MLILLFRDSLCLGAVKGKRGPVKGKRGPVYCRKLTALPPGEKINVEFDRDGIPIGKNSSIFAFFLGEQVRNRAVIPVQVEGWTEIKSEKIEHLWSCVLVRKVSDA